eukprot:139-Prymnesium_polylepis.1
MAHPSLIWQAARDVRLVRHRHLGGLDRRVRRARRARAVPDTAGRERHAEGRAARRPRDDRPEMVRGGHREARQRQGAAERQAVGGAEEGQDGVPAGGVEPVWGARPPRGALYRGA